MKASELRALAAELIPKQWERPFFFVLAELRRFVERAPKTTSVSFSLRAYEELFSLNVDGDIRKQFLEGLRKDGYSADIKSGSLIVSWEEGR